jgi:hypothetical protein
MVLSIFLDLNPLNGKTNPIRNNLKYLQLKFPRVFQNSLTFEIG